MKIDSKEAAHALEKFDFDESAAMNYILDEREKEEQKEAKKKENERRKQEEKKAKEELTLQKKPSETSSLIHRKTSA